MSNNLMDTNHPNKTFKNRLIYIIGEKFLKNYTPYFKGILYDFGCGERPYEGFFLQYVDEYVGIDWSDTQHSLTADIIVDLNKPLPIKSEVANTIISISVMEHLCEPQNMLNEAFRILKKDGYIILQVPFQWWVHEDPHDYFRYTSHGLRYMFEKAGFTEIKVEPQSGFFTMWILKFNYFTSRLVRGPRLIKFLIYGLLVPVWLMGQAVAPILDKLDRDWERETSGYYVIAKKKTNQG